MAAQTFTTKYYRQPAVFAANFPGIIERSVTLDLDTLIGPDGTDATPLEAADILKLFKLPQGAKLLYGVIESEDLDTSTGITLDLGVTDGTTTKLFFDEATIAQAGGRADSRDAGATGALDAFDSNAASGYVITNGNFYVYLSCGTAASGTFQNDGIRVTIGYSLALEVDEGNRDWPSPIPS